eukprot:gene45427-61548_t
MNRNQRLRRFASARNRHHTLNTSLTSAISVSPERFQRTSSHRISHVQARYAERPGGILPRIRTDRLEDRSQGPPDLCQPAVLPGQEAFFPASELI